LKRILLGFLVAGTVGTTAIVATNAFFSDTSTSSGNLFQAGKLNLLVDSK
jgi:predicted ribosomally synthesized peptide with SipW-like signal peptide